MEKLLGLLHEGTIVDFRALYTSGLRYRWLFLCAMILFFVSLGINYFNQPIIYAVSIPLKSETTHKISTDLSALLPMENANPITVEEINISLSSYTFISNLARSIVDSRDFSKINLGSMKSVKSLWGYQIAKACKANKECMMERVAGVIREFFFIEAGATATRFTLTVNTIDKNTTRSLEKIIVNAIEQDRVRLKQITVQKEIDNVSHLIEESRTLLQKMGGYEVLQDQEKLHNSIENLKEEIKMLQFNSTVETANNSALQAKLLETKRRSTASVENKEVYEAQIKIYSRLKEIRHNIIFLSHGQDDRKTSADKMILAQLKNERDRLIDSLPAEQRLRAMQIAEDSQERSLENVGNVEFDYTVSKNKQNKLNADYEEARAELDQLLQKKVENETRINGMRSDLDFLKGLESKHMSLKLINATMNSDLIFEDGTHLIEEFKRASLPKLSLFSFFITGFFYLLALVIKHSLDDKIYDEDDIRLYFKNLDFVGEVPSFD